ncbi:hypothetical protein AK812_SmicGene5745 [Symbiodinium microadriaticum]|uniref:Uncharacterized protein n=1 Tax=Symbiodinium microadriaticum TaxID=2951 RepID=A0A1Q9ESZ6_SYMMI|nr:hypothetical protein AK812_SmicGene5745 [Symbiodinium microadriaticum]
MGSKLELGTMPEDADPGSKVSTAAPSVVSALSLALSKAPSLPVLSTPSLGEEEALKGRTRAALHRLNCGWRSTYGSMCDDIPKLAEDPGSSRFGFVEFGKREEKVLEFAYKSTIRAYLLPVSQEPTAARPKESGERQYVPTPAELQREHAAKENHLKLIEEDGPAYASGNRAMFLRGRGHNRAEPSTKGQIRQASEDVTKAGLEAADSQPAGPMVEVDYVRLPLAQPKLPAKSPGVRVKAMRCPWPSVVAAALTALVSAVAASWWSWKQLETRLAAQEERLAKDFEKRLAAHEDRLTRLEQRYETGHSKRPSVTAEEPRSEMPKSPKTLPRRLQHHAADQPKKTIEENFDSFASYLRGQASFMEWLQCLFGVNKYGELPPADKRFNCDPMKSDLTDAELATIT